MSMQDKNNPMEANKKPQIKQTPLIDKWVLIFGLVVFLSIVAPIGYLIVQSVNRPPRDLRIDVRNKNGSQGDSKVDECDNCSRLVIKDKNGNPVFEGSLENTGDNRLRQYLISKAADGDERNRNTTIKLYNDKFPNRLVDISFDISNSVVDRDRDSLKNKADVRYSDSVFQKFKEYMLGSDSLLPGDITNVRFYGPELKNNPCNNKLVVKYIEPEWSASIVYSKHNKQLLVELGDKIPPTTKKTSSEIITNDLNEIYSALQSFYAGGISNPNPGCHFGTYLIPHLTQISDDIVNKEYKNYKFVLVTDGEFYLRSDEITGGKEVYVSPKNYDVIKSYLDNKSDKEFMVNGSPICKSPSDRFIIVGMEYDNNFSYRQILQRFYQELLKSCHVVFENS